MNKGKTTVGASPRRAQSTGQYRWAMVEISLTDPTWNKSMRSGLFQHGPLRGSKESFSSAKFREDHQICWRKRRHNTPTLSTRGAWVNIPTGAQDASALCARSVYQSGPSGDIASNSSRIDFQDRSAPVWCPTLLEYEYST